MYRSSRQDLFCKKGALRSFAKFTGKHLCHSLFLIKLQASGNIFISIKKEILARVFCYSYRLPPVAASECSRSMEFEKRTDQNFSTQNLREGKEYCISKNKKLLKQCLKEVIYEYILAFARWWSIFWKVVGSGGCILAAGVCGAW